ncbi:MAG: hypothetical protein ABW007_01860 [Chitinophagaceae bacterium]
MKSLVGALGAAGGAGLAAGGAIAGVSVAMIGLAAIAQSSNVQVAEAYKGLWNEVKAGTQDMTESTVPYLISSAEQLRQTFRDISPDLAEMFAAAAPNISILTDGISGLIKNSMPGLKASVLSSRPVFEGLNTLLKETGTGISNFFTGISQGAPGAGSMLASLGKIINSVLTGSGQLIGTLATQGAPAFARFAAVIDQVTVVVNQLASGALPIMFSAIGAGLNVLSGFVSLLGGAQSVIGPLIGTVVTAAAAFKLLDAVSFGRLTDQLNTVRTSVGQATSVTGKLGAGLGGLATGLGPIGLAIGGLTLVLGLLGQKQQEAAQKTQEHKSRVDTLAAALRESNGVYDSNVNALVAKTLAETEVAKSGKNVLQTARELGIALPKVTEAYLGNAKSQGEVNTQLDEIIKNNTEVDTSTGTTIETLNGQGQSAKDLKDKMGELNGTTGDAIQKNKDMAAASRDSASATRDNVQAMVDLNNQLLASVDKSFAYRTAVDNTAEAEANLVEVGKKHKVGSEEHTKASKKVEAAYISQTRAAYDMGYATSTATTEQGKQADGSKALAAEVITMAKAVGEQAPESLRRMVAGMSAAELQANGVTVSVNGAGQSVYQLPGGKTMTIDAKDFATEKAIAVQKYLNNMPAIKWVTINVNTIYDYASVGSAYNIPGGMSAGRRAGGGPVEALKPYWVGEEGPELIFPDRSGYVATAQESARLMGQGGRSNLSTSSSDSGLTVVFNAPVFGLSGMQEVAKIIDEEQKKNNRRNGR